MIEYTVRVYDSGDKFWYLNGELHRADGPAAEIINGYKAWFLKGERHRLDGPAVVHSDGSKEWWLKGRGVTEEEHNKLTSKTPCQGKVVEIDGIKYKLEEV